MKALRALSEGCIKHCNPQEYYATEHNVELACHVDIKLVLDMSRHSKHHLSYTKTIKVNILKNDLRRILKGGKTLRVMVIS